jgi:hypothetical protein
MRLFDVQSKPRQLVVRFFSSLSHYAIRRPKPALVIAVIVTLTAALGVFRLKLRTDGHALVPQSAPEVIYDKTIRDQFGIEDQVVVVIRSDSTEGIFNPSTLQLVRDLTAEFMRMPDIHSAHVMSLATEPGFHLRPGTLTHQTLLEPQHRTKAQLGQLREDVRRIGLYTGTLVSADGKATVVLIGVPAGCDCVKLYSEVLQIIAAKQPVPEEIGVTGAPVAESLLGNHILEDLGVPRTLLGPMAQARTPPVSRSAGGAGDDAHFVSQFPQRAGGARAVARGRGDDAVCVRVNGRIGGADLPDHRHHARAAHDDQRHQRYLFVQSLFHFAPRKAPRQPRRTRPRNDG